MTTIPVSNRWRVAALVLAVVAAAALAFAVYKDSEYNKMRALAIRAIVLNSRILLDRKADLLKTSGGVEIDADGNPVDAGK